MKFDVSRFKKVSSDENCTILKDPDGHEFKIAHKALRPELKKQINSIPQHFEEGGEVASPIEEDEESPGIMEKLNNFVNDVNSVAADASAVATEDLKAKENPGSVFAGKTDPALVSSEGPTPASIEPPVSAPVPAPVPAPVQQPAPVAAADNYAMGALGKQRQGLQQEASALGDLGQKEAEIAQQEQASLEKLNADYQTNLKRLTDERAQIIKEIETQKINPNNYMESMSTGQRIRSAIGLIISGFGAGLSGQQNMAEKFLNQAIERDIESQKANLGKKQSLLQYNLQEMGNMKDAMEVTKATMLGVNASRLKQAAALTQDPLAKARALQAAGKLEMEAAPLIQQAAQRQALLQGVKGGTANPAMAINVLVPKDQQAAAMKELGEFNALQGALGEVDRTIDGFGDVGAVDRANPFTPDKIAQKKSALVGVVKPLLGESMQEADVERMVNPFVPGVLSNSADARAKAKVELKNQILSRVKGRTPILSSYGLVPDPGKVNFKPLGK